MKILNLIDKIYENEYFTTFLIVAFVLLLLLFCLVFIIGMRDAKKAKMPPEEKEEDVKDITFDLPKEAESIKEDVTFEMPVLTKNLENFKKNLEEEIQTEDIAEVRKTSGIVLPKVNKAVKILDMDAIEDTSILPNIKENTHSTQKREIEMEIEKPKPKVQVDTKVDKK